MISIHNLAKFLNKGQDDCYDDMGEFQFETEKPKTLYQKYMIDDDFKEKATDKTVPEILSNLFTSEEHFKTFFLYDDDVKVVKDNTFIYSLLSQLNKEFKTFDPIKKWDYIKEWCMRLASDYTLKDLHKKFRYSRKGIYKFSAVTKILTDISNGMYNIDLFEDSILKKYFADYYNINIYEVAHNGLTIQVNCICATIDNETYNKYLPAIIIYKQAKKYYPLTHESNNNILRYSVDNDFMDRVEGYFNKKKRIRVSKKSKDL